MDEPGPTDVLSFPMDELRPAHDDEDPEPEGLLGDVVLCPAVAAKQAAAAGHAPDEELDLLTSTASCTCSATTTPSRTRSREMFGLQARAARRLGAHVAARARPVTDRYLARWSSRPCWSCVAGLLAGAEAALVAASRARAPRAGQREGRRGAPRLRPVLDDPPRYLNVLLLLRGCSASSPRPSWSPCVPRHASTADLAGRARRVRVDDGGRRYVAIGVSPRTLGRQHAERVARRGAPA